MAVADIPAEQIVNNRTSFSQFLWLLPGDEERYRWDASIGYMYAVGAVPVPGQGLPPQPPVPTPGSPFTLGEVAWLNALYIRTINGVGPDDDGNVIVEGGGGGTVDEYARQQAEQANQTAQAKYTKPDAGIPESDLAASIVSKLAAGATAYTKPSGGIPKTDLAATVGTSLGKADTAYQKPSTGIPTTDFASAVQSAIAKAATSVQPSDLAAYVKTVNGYTPDAAGNVTVPTGGGGGGGVDSVNGRLGAVTLTAADVGLSHVNDTADADKPISDAVAAALDNRVQTVNGVSPDASGNVVVSGGSVPGVTSVNDRTGAVTLTAADVGLSHVNDTADADKPVSTAQGQAIAQKYTKPASGIPSSDLTAAAQGQLNKAASAAQTVAGKSPDSNGAITLGPSDVGAAPASHTHQASQISDATSVGRGVMTAATTAAARSVLGAGDYSKPSTGVPLSDLAQAVLDLLNHGDTAYSVIANGGRLGSFSQDISSTDLNDRTITGFYRGQSMLNAPIANNDWFYVLVESHDGTNWVKQTATAYSVIQGASGLGTWIRQKRNGTWDAWARIADVAGGYDPTARAAAAGAVKTVNNLTPDANGALTLSTGAGPDYSALQDIRYVAYGHSFGQQQGYWNSTAAGTYPNRVRDNLLIDSGNFANATVSGQRAAAMATTVKGHWDRGWYGLVSLMICQNDAGYRTDITAFKASIQSAIDWIRGPGEFPPTIVLVLDTYSTQVGYNRYPTPLTDAVMDQYNQAVRDVAALYPSDGSIVIADANANWDRNTMTAPDGQHPNDRGSAAIAKAICAALANKPFREGQNMGLSSPTYIYDGFGRPNNTDIKGTMYGKSYTIYSAQAGVTFGVKNNTAYRSSTGDTTSEAIAVLDSGSGSVDISAVMTNITTKGMGIAWRASDINNYWCLDVRTGQNPIVYQKVGGAAFAAIGSPFSIAVNNGDTVRITHNNAGTIRGYVNGVLAFSGTNNALNTNTKHGIRITEAPSSSSTIDDLIIK